MKVSDGGAQMKYLIILLLLIPGVVEAGNHFVGINDMVSGQNTNRR